MPLHSKFDKTAKLSQENIHMYTSQFHRNPSVSLKFPSCQADSHMERKTMTRTWEFWLGPIFLSVAAESKVFRNIMASGQNFWDCLVTFNKNEWHQLIAAAHLKTNNEASKYQPLYNQGCKLNVKNWKHHVKSAEENDYLAQAKTQQQAFLASN